MTGAHKRYDSKHKVTRLLLSDYLVLKEFAQRAGVSMAEALHTIITDQAAFVAKPISSMIAKPISATISPMTAKPITSMIAKAIPASGILSINGDKHVAVAACRTKGGKIHD